MMTLKQQLERATGQMLIANIPNTNYTMKVDYKYTTNERIICLDCEQGEANLVTEHDVTVVKLKDGDILELDAYMVMNPYEQTAWETLYENAFLSHLYEKRDTDGDGVTDELFRFDTKSDEYYATSGANFMLQSDVEAAIAEGTLDPKALKGIQIITQEQYDSLMSGDNIVDPDKIKEFVPRPGLMLFGTK